MAGTRSMGNSLVLQGEGSEEDVVLGNVASIGELNTEAEEIETTTLDSPNGAKEFIQGAKDSGTLQVVLNNVYDGTVETLNSIFDSGETRDWLWKFKDHNDTEFAAVDFDAFIISRAFNESTPEGLDQVTFGLRITGSPTYSEES